MTVPRGAGWRFWREDAARGGEGPWWAAWLLWLAVALLAPLGCTAWAPLELPGVVVGGGRDAAHWEPIGGEARWVAERWWLLVLTEEGVQRVPSTLEQVTTTPAGTPVYVRGQVSEKGAFRAFQATRAAAPTATPPPGRQS